jgi:hypothetical protein
VYLSRQAYQDLKDELTQARADIRAQVDANKVLQTNMDWFRLRITQIEKERAQLIHHALGVKIPTPEFEVSPDAAKQQFFQDHPFHQDDIFRGLSDAEARKQGIELDAEGRLVETT